MTISSKHPQYSEQLLDWQKMRDSYKGSRAVKSKGVVYLPPTTSQLLDGFDKSDQSIGRKSYDSYKLRARFPNFVREAVQMAVGMMHSQPAVIELPERMKNIRSSKGEPLSALLRKINTEQLITGRVGVLADLPNIPSVDSVPSLCLYSAENIINWDDGSRENVVPKKLNLVVLDESENVRDNDFSWVSKTKFRVLTLGNLNVDDISGTYIQGVFEENEFNPSDLKAPTFLGKTLNQIPFVFVNSCDTDPDVDDPPLLDLAEICMTIYRGEADYRQNLFLQGQDTLITIGGNFESNETVRVGANARIDLPLGGDAKYIGVDGSGLSEQREALQRLESRAGSMGAQTLDTTSRERESGDSLRIRVAARTADLNQIVDAGALALENILKMCAEWMGEDPNKVVVKPNKEFGEMPLTGQTMVEMATARNLGFPISARSLHDLAVKRRITSKSFEEEQEEAKKEASIDSFPFAKAANGDRSADQPNKDPDNQRSGLQGSK